MVSARYTYALEKKMVLHVGVLRPPGRTWIGSRCPLLCTCLLAEAAATISMADKEDVTAAGLRTG
jgi:hypothetical protein